jgi:hypothetical protein
MKNILEKNGKKVYAVYCNSKFVAAFPDIERANMKLKCCEISGYKNLKIKKIILSEKNIKNSIKDDRKKFHDNLKYLKESVKNEKDKKRKKVIERNIKTLELLSMDLEVLLININL